MAGRRLLMQLPQLTRRAWEDVAPELERFLRRLWESEGSGLPAGAATGVPSQVNAGDIGATGTPTLGWVPLDHEHPVPTGAPSDLANATQEGTSPAIPRLDHKHKRDVRVKQNNADFATKNALDFNSDFTLTVDVPNDDVGIAISPSGTALDDAYAFAFLGY